MAIDLFKLRGVIEVDNDKANKALDDTSKKGNSAQSKLSKAFGVVGKGAAVAGKAIAVGMAAGATAVGALVTKSVQAYAEFEQLEGGVETLFGTGGQSLEEFTASVSGSVDDIKKFQKEAGIAVDGVIGPQTMAAIQNRYKSLTAAQDKVMQNATKAYKTAGMSANAYMETVTGFSASLISSLGGDTEKAAALADQAIIDMADNANKMGTDIESIQNAYQGFAKQNYTMLDNLKLGYGGTKEEMQRLLKDAEKLTGKKFDISNFADITEAIHAIQTEMGITGTTANEASTTISGSISSMQAAWENMLVAISADDMPFEQYVNDFSTSVATVAENLLPRISTALGGVVMLINAVAPIIIEKLPGLFNQLLPSVIEAATGLVNSLVSAAPGILESLTGCLPALILGVTTILLNLAEQLPFLFGVVIEALPSVIEALVSALPTLIPALIDGIVAMIVALCTNFGQIIQPILDALPGALLSICVALVDNLPLLLAAAWDLICGIASALPGYWKGLLDALDDLLTHILVKLIEWCEPIIASVAEWWDGVKTAASEKWEEIKTAVSDKVGELKESASTKFNEVKTAISDKWEEVKTATGEKWDSIKTAASEKWDSLKSTASTKWNSIKTAISGKVDEAQGNLSTAWGAVKTTASTAWDSVKTTASTKWASVKSAISEKAESLKSGLSTKWAGVKTAASSAWTSIQSTASSKWESVKGTISEKAESLRSTLSTKWNSIFTAASTSWSGIKTKASSVWSGIKDSIGNAIGGAKDLVDTAISTIKGLFDFKFKWPDLPMPHFSFSGSMNPLKWAEEGVPKISVKWYAEAMKMPKLLNDPSIFGYDAASGRFLGGGEAGSEMVGGTSAIMGMIRAAVAGQMNALAYYLERLLEVLETYFPQVLAVAGHDIVTNDGVIIGHYAPMFDEALGEIQKGKDRGR